MSAGRSAGTVTLLDGAPCREAVPPEWCGKVLAVGGLSSSGYLDSAELYDPATRTWSPTGGTRKKRWLHKAVTLPSGKVLVIGGGISNKTAEVYDPEIGRWTVTAPPVQGGLREFAASVLNDGRVLVVGGQMYPVGANVAQIYNPANDEWVLTTPMSVGRYNPVTVRLADGRVLVAGGSPGAPTAEVYDSVLQAWTPTGPLVTPFANSCEGPPCNTATLLNNGEVLVTGGEVVDKGVDEFLERAGIDAGLSDARRSSQLFDPDTLQWRAGPQMHQPRMKSTATKLRDGRVLLAGGAIGTPGSANGSDGAIDSAEIYDPVANEWRPTGSFVDGRGLHDAVLLDNGRCQAEVEPGWCGKVLAVGGASRRGKLASAELFDPHGATRPPTVLEIAPRSGPSSGGTVVTITGANLAAVSGVHFGTQPAEVFEHDQATPDSKMTVVTPALPPGPVDIMLTTSHEVRSPLVSQARFTFYRSGEWTQSEAPPGVGSAATLLAEPGCALACGRVLVSGGPNGEAWLYDPMNGWEETGSLHGSRFHHTQTVLADGRVLVVGGQTGPEYTAPPTTSAEIYDPDTGEWSVIDGPAIPRRDHATTRLVSGHVLVTGGLDRGTSGPIGSVGIGGEPAEAQATPEIFNPATNSWSVTGALATGRAYHTAVLLDGPECVTASAPDYCGRVLVAGGMDSAFDPLRSAELYDPGSGTWAPTGELGESRVFHTMTLITRPSCGDSGSANACAAVMVTGGFGGPRQSSEVYDPATGAWRVSASMNAGRSGHTATVLAGGSVLIAGGEGLAGRRDPTVEIFDASGESWTVTGPMLSARSGHFAVALPDGRVLAGGGCCSPSAELYESSRTRVPPSIAALDPVSGPTLGGTSVSVRGRGLSGRSVAVRFDGVPAEVTFASGSRVDVITPPHRQGEVAVTVAVTGTDGGIETAGPLEFTYGSGTWRNGEPAGSCSGCRERYLHTATPLADGRVLVAGGTVNFLLFFTNPGAEDAALTSTQILDPQTGKWSATQSMTSGRFSHSATALADGTILVAGGQDALGKAIRSSEIYDPKTQKWTEVGPLSTARFSHTATLLNDGRVLVVGGAPTEERRDTPLPTAEVYNPATGQWSPADSLSVARVNHTATLLPNGKVLVAGGIGHSTSEGELPSVPPRFGPGFPPQLGDAPHAIALKSTEVFDPSSGSWEDGPPMAVARFSHTATVLAGHACSMASPAICGRILVAGGSQGGPGGTMSTELFDPDKREWSAVSNLRSSRAGHAATLLPDGTVLVAGGGPTFPGQEAPGPLASAEVFDPSIRWRYTSGLTVARAGMTLSALPDGDVVAVGGYQEERASMFPVTFTVTLSEPTEIYRSAPRIFGLNPQIAPATAGFPVRVTGTGLATAERVMFGELAAVSFDITSPMELEAMPPAQPSRSVEVAVVNSGGTSARTPPNRAAIFRYVEGAGRVTDLTAGPLSDSAIQLSFTSPDDGTGSARATRYLIKQSPTAINSAAAFEAATTVLGSDRVFDQAVTIRLVVSDLEPGTTYHYALRAIDALGAAGPMSNNATATTHGVPIDVSAKCSEVELADGRVAYPSGYSLVGLPSGTALPGAGALFSWFQQGAGGAYTAHDPATVLEHGYGYWAYFGCPAAVPVKDGQHQVSFPLGAYHASMVGNPSATAPAVATGHDFAARWDPALNAGAGGYHISGYQQPQTLAVGEGSWVFSYVPTTIEISAGSP